MTHDSPPSTPPPPGFYQDADGVTRWWDGQRWTEQVLPMGNIPQTEAAQQVVYSQRMTGKGYLRGGSLTNPQHLFHAIVTVCTLGLWAPVWILMWWLGRRRIQ